MKPIDVPILVVLGAPNDERGKLLPVAEGRALATLREYQRDPSQRVLLTGGFGAHFNTTSRPHFDHVAEFLEGRGMPASAILGRILTGNTVDDAQKTAEFLADYQPPLRLRVVTSDFHLTRARWLFERAFHGAASVEMIATAVPLPPHELSALLRHEAEAMARLGAQPTARR